ncbi:hypothetical protein BH24CHL4_BH24CHL4_24970 [soil metagenome]
MNARVFVSAWRGRVYRHTPAITPFGPLDSGFAARTPDNRRNTAGEPILYFGSDFGVLVAEFGRHFRELRFVDIGEHTRDRRLYAVDLDLDRVFDLRKPEAAMHLELSDVPACFLARSIAQSAASLPRNGLGIQAVFVLSMALHDDPSRWNLVLFIDQLGGSINDVVNSVSEMGTFRFEGPNELSRR